MSISLSEEKIKAYANRDYLITIAESVTSTNTILKEQARQGAPHGSVLIAKEQLCGRGRLGRSFYSPKNSGLYMSALLKSSVKTEFSQFITPAAAVAVARGLKLSGLKNPGIKWVNDIFNDGKKICGILTETEFSKASNSPDFFVVGIGINLNTQDFPDDIKKIAGAAFNNADFNSNKLCADILDNLFDLCENLNPSDFIDEYRSLSILSNRDVTLIRCNEKIPAHILGIDDSFRLIAKLSNNEVLHISTGEVSIKL